MSMHAYVKFCLWTIAYIVLLFVLVQRYSIYVYMTVYILVSVPQTMLPVRGALIRYPCPHNGHSQTLEDLEVVSVYGVRVTITVPGIYV